MQHRLPAYFQSGKKERSIEIDGLTMIRFRQTLEYQRKELFLSTHLLHVLLSGKKRIHEGTRVHSFSGGEAFFLKQGYCVYGEILEEDLPFQNLLFFFEPKLLDEFVGKYPRESSQSGSSKSLFTIEVNSILKGFVESVLPLFETSLATDKNLLKLKFFELLYNLAFSPGNTEFKSFLFNLRGQKHPNLQLLMKNNFMKPFTVEQFSKLAGRSVSSFKRDFFSCFHLPPGEWLRHQRLHRARFLLSTTNRNVTEICYDCGYQNLSHFIQAFKKEFGQTPKQLTKNNTF